MILLMQAASPETLLHIQSVAILCIYCILAGILYWEKKRQCIFIIRVQVNSSSIISYYPKDIYLNASTCVAITNNN